MDAGQVAFCGRKGGSDGVVERQALLYELERQHAEAAKLVVLLLVDDFFVVRQVEVGLLDRDAGQRRGWRCRCGREERRGGGGGAGGSGSNGRGRKQVQDVEAVQALGRDVDIERLEPRAPGQQGEQAEVEKVWRVVERVFEPKDSQFLQGVGAVVGEGMRAWRVDDGDLDAPEVRVGLEDERIQARRDVVALDADFLEVSGVVRED